MPEAEISTDAGAEKIMVLLVDDRAENLLAYPTILAELDLGLVMARSGAEALKQVLLTDFAVILLDVNMPGMDGFETATLIRRRKRSAHTPIIFLTAFHDEFRAAEGYAHGAVDFLTTPVVPEILRAKVKVFVELFRMTQRVKRQTEERLALVQERMHRAAAEEANQQLRFLAEVTAVIGQSLDYNATAGDVARLVVPTLGDHAVVARYDAARRLWQLIQASAARPTPLIEESPNLESLPRHLVEGIEQTLAKGTPSFFPKVEPVSANGEPQAVVLPLNGQKSTLAALAISREPSGRRLTSADLTVAGAVASRAAIALENAQLYKNLEGADRQKNEFLSMLAHELRNPLAPIRTAVDVLRLRGDADSELVWARNIIDRQTAHLVRLVDDLLDVSRITGGKIRLAFESADVSTIVASAVETSRPLVAAGEHELTVSLLDEPLWVNCDRVRLSQVLANLLNNAAKYTQRGGKISLSAQREGDEAVFRVRDNGIGIPSDMLSQVFELFTQVDRSLDRSQGGLGIGLTLVRRMVEKHGGRVEAASDGPGCGAEFTVRLPALAGPPPAAAGGESSEQSPDQRTPASVLVVDDNVDAADSVAWLLRMKEHAVRTVHDGRAAIDAARLFRPQVVILDLGLPGLDGYEVARRLRSLPETKNSLLIAVSGYGQDEHRRQATDAGFNHHFVKPVNFEILLQAIDKASGPSERPLTASSSPASR